MASNMQSLYHIEVTLHDLMFFSVMQIIRLVFNLYVLLLRTDSVSSRFIILSIAFKEPTVFYYCAQHPQTSNINLKHPFY